MTVNVRKFIEGQTGTSLESFTGAVILTYTLNLNFYEQIISQSFDRAGCGNVLILADPDGYAGAIEMGAKTISGAGLRYVCTPIARYGAGIQHVKLVLMAGPKRGRLLIGSGNLTLHGYSRNLELFSAFDYDPSQPSPEMHYAFSQCWNLLLRLKGEGHFPRAALDQLEAIEEKADWILRQTAAPNQFRVWHSYETSIWQQLLNWRTANGFSQLLTLRVISPYYDKDMAMLLELTKALSPSRVEIFVDPSSTNLNGTDLLKRWSQQPQKLAVNQVDAENSKHERPLHAKAIIGIEANAAWCLTGSPNLTAKGMDCSWRQGGNLELATFRWQPEPTAFDYLLQDGTIRIRVIDPGQVLGTELEPSERLSIVDSSFFLAELVSRGRTLQGKLSNLPSSCPRTGTLRFLRSAKEIAITVDSALEFQIDLPSPTHEAEAALLELGNQVTPYRWIDYPDALAQFGARSYHREIGGKLETFQGAGKLLEELMNFLWQRFDPTKITEEMSKEGLQKRGTSTKNAQDNGTSPPPPPPAEFITDEEFVEHLRHRAGQHSPYDRSLWSLRDLISLALLRLTAQTRSAEVISETGEIDDSATQQITRQRELDQKSVRERLRTYLLQYSKRYGERLCQMSFIEQTNADLIFQNHFTLGQVLLEFSAKVEEFTPDDLRTCFWWTWAPLVWPGIVKLRGNSALTLLIKSHTRDEVTDGWRESGMPVMTAKVIVQALFWHYAHLPESDPKRVGDAMITRELIRRVGEQLGAQALTFDVNDWRRTGLRELNESSESSDENDSFEFESLRAKFETLATYVPPTERRFSRLKDLQELYRSGQGESAGAKELIQWFLDNRLENDLPFKTSGLPLLPLKWGAEYCPKCFLTQSVQNMNRLRRGELVRCSVSGDALFYWRPQLPKTVF